MDAQIVAQANFNDIIITPKKNCNIGEAYKNLRNDVNQNKGIQINECIKTI